VAPEIHHSGSSSSSSNKKLAPYKTGGGLLLTANFKVTLQKKLGQKSGHNKL